MFNKPTVRPCILRLRVLRDNSGAQTDNCPLFHLAYLNRRLTPPSSFPEISQLCLPTGLSAVFSLYSLLVSFVRQHNFRSHSIHMSLFLFIMHLSTRGQGQQMHICIRASSPHQHRTECFAFRHQKGCTNDSGTWTMVFSKFQLFCSFVERPLNHACSSLCYKHWMSQKAKKAERPSGKHHIFTLEQRQGFIRRALSCF